MEQNPYQSPDSIEPRPRMRIPRVLLAIPTLLVVASLLGLEYIDLSYDYSILADGGDTPSGNAIRAREHAEVVSRQFAFAIWTLVPSVAILAVQLALLLSRRGRHA